MKTFTPEQYIEALGRLSPEAKRMILEDDTGTPSMTDVAQEFNISNEKTQIFVKICVPILYGLVPISEMPEQIVAELALDKDAATRICQRCKDTFLRPVWEQFGDTPAAKETGDEQTLESKQDDGNSKSNQELVIKIKERGGEMGSVKLLSIIENVVKNIKEDVTLFKFTEEQESSLNDRRSNLAEPVKKVIADGVYKDAVIHASKDFGLDGEALAGIQMEVLLFLFGLRNRAELRELLKNHPSLTAAQGAESMTNLEKTLFSPLADYLSKDGEGDVGLDSVLLMASINESVNANERMNKLPSGVQDVIKGEDLQKAFVTLVRKHSLSADVARTIAKHVSVVLVGLGTTNDFKVNVTKDTGLDPSKLEAVFQDVEISLFKPVRTAILTALEQKKAGTAPTATTVPANDPYKTEAS